MEAPIPISDTKESEHKKVAPTVVKRRRDRVRGVTVTAIAKAYPFITRKTWSIYVNHEGCPATTLASALQWLRKNHPECMKGLAPSSDPSEWTKSDWQKFKIQKEVRDMDFAHEIKAGKYHDSAACCQSLGQILNERLQPFLSLHQRIKSRYPELPQAAMEAIKVEVDEAFEAIRNGVEQ